MAGLLFRCAGRSGGCGLLHRPVARAWPRPAAATPALHSLPAYHGLFVARGIVLVPMLIVFADRRAARRAGWRSANALSYFSGRHRGGRAASAAPRCAMSSTCQPGSMPAQPTRGADARRPRAYAQTLSIGELAGARARRCSRRSLRPCWCSDAASPRRFRARNHFERFVDGRARDLRGGRGPDHHRHRLLGCSSRPTASSSIRRSRDGRPSRSSCSARNGTRRRRCAPTRATSSRRSASFRC